MTFMRVIARLGILCVLYAFTLHATEPNGLRVYPHAEVFASPGVAN
jgi:hypothetical protein